MKTTKKDDVNDSLKAFTFSTNNQLMRTKNRMSFEIFTIDSYIATAPAYLYFITLTIRPNFCSLYSGFLQR